MTNAANPRPATNPVTLDWPSIGYQAACLLLGPNNSRLSRSDGTELRWGRQGSFRYSRRSGYWQDFERGESGDVLDLVIRERGGDRRQAYDWLVENGLAESNSNANYNATYNATYSANYSGSYAAPAPPRFTPEELLRRWERTYKITEESWHPARRWLNHRNLWPQDQEPPAALRWRPRYRIDPEAQCYGAVTALLASPQAWLEARDTSPKGLPAPQALQGINIGKQGQPAPDQPLLEGGVTKRTIGPSRNSVCWLGTRTEPKIVRIVEGIADALALTSRTDDTEAVWATTGTSGWHQQQLADALAGLNCQVILHPDPDQGGQQANAAMTELLQAREVKVETAPADPQGRDPADLAASDPFPSKDTRKQPSRKHPTK